MERKEENLGVIAASVLSCYSQCIMAMIAVPTQFTKHKNLIAVPRNEYERFLVWEKKIKSLDVFKPTSSEKKALLRGRKNLAKRHSVTLNELEYELRSGR